PGAPPIRPRSDLREREPPRGGAGWYGSGEASISQSGSAARKGMRRANPSPAIDRWCIAKKWSELRELCLCSQAEMDWEILPITLGKSRRLGPSIGPGDAQPLHSRF